MDRETDLHRCKEQPRLAVQRHTVGRWFHSRNQDTDVLQCTKGDFISGDVDSIHLGNALQTSAQFGATGAARETGTAAGRVIQSFTGLNSKLLSALGGIGDANAREQRDLGSLALDNAGNRIQLNQNRSNALVNAVGGGVDTENRRIASNALSRQNLIGDLSQAGSTYMTSRFGGGGGGDSVLTPPKMNTPAQNQAARDAGINIEDYHTKKKVTGTGKTRIGDNRLSQKEMNALGIF